MEKAKKIGIVDRNRYCTIIEYEYRCKRYDVEYANDWTYCAPSVKAQHENAQARIDKEIEEETKPKKETRYEDTAEYGFEMFWNYVEGV